MSSTHHGILIHIIFSTKLRAPVIANAWQDDLFAYIGGTAKDHKATLIAAGGIEDHVHLLAKIHPSFAISNTVKLIKDNSSRWINEQRKAKAKFEW
jgi:putative transposase